MYHWDVIGYFIWDLLETPKRRTDGTSLLRPLETLSRHSNKMSWKRTTETSWRRSTETSLGASFKTNLRLRWDVHRDVVKTSSCRVGSLFLKNANNLFGSTGKSFCYKLEPSYLCLEAKFHFFTGLVFNSSSLKKMNILRISKRQKWRKFKKNDPQLKLTGSYKKDCISFFNNKEQIFLWIIATTILKILSSRDNFRLDIFHSKTLLYSFWE